MRDERCEREREKKEERRREKAGLVGSRLRKGGKSGKQAASSRVGSKWAEEQREYESN